MLSSLSLCASPEIRAGYIIQLILPAAAMAPRAGKSPNHLYIVRIDTEAIKEIPHRLHNGIKRIE